MEKQDQSIPPFEHSDPFLDIDEQFICAYDLFENTPKNVFVTGKAGTGKSTLLQYFRDHTTKNVVALAPTGVAAVNVQGQTIHSFFRFRPDITPESVYTIKMSRERRKMYSQIDTIIIDEISMVRADLLDCIDAFLQLYGKHQDLPFGGIQLIFFGDLYQLPPVVTRREEKLFQELYASPYFFDAKSISSIKMEFFELTNIHRQTETNFIELLNAVRNREVEAEHLNLLNSRVDPWFKPEDDDFYIYLTTTNKLADEINEMHLNQLQDDLYYHEGAIAGKFESRELPTHENLEFKVGAQVMMLNNEPTGRWFNGSIGKIISIIEEAEIIVVELADGEVIEVFPFTWEMHRFFFNEDTEMIESERIGAFTQFPLRLAWAVTIHKSQGKTFSKVILDIGYGTFAYGQIYVALSRCTSLKGLVLKKPILKKHILLDDHVVDFMKKIKKNSLL